MRRKNAFYLNEQLGKIKGIEVPIEEKNCRHVYQMYTIKVDKKIDRNAFVKKLNENGIQASVHFYPPVHLQPAYLKNGWKSRELKVTEEVSKRIVTLPMYPQLSKEELDFIVENVKETVSI